MSESRTPPGRAGDGSGSKDGDGARARHAADERAPAPPALAELPLHPGLCAGCVHLRLLRSSRSVFVFCGKSADDERFPRYPRLPVVTCEGYVSR